jgi:integrase/recombinase XerD
MKLSTVIAEYVQVNEAMGVNLRTTKSHFRSLTKIVGDVEIDAIDEKQVGQYLMGSGPLTGTYFGKYSAINSLFKFACVREYMTQTPLPKTLPEKPPKFEPYIYSTEEIRKILIAAEQLDGPKRAIEFGTMRAILILLYGAVLRLGEALSLKVEDVDFDEGLLVINRSKFNKTRIVPISLPLLEELKRYEAAHPNRRPDDWFFVTRRGAKVCHPTIEQNFRLFCKGASVSRDGGPDRQPRLHDLRHSGTVHRMVQWYREGKDVQKLLPLLSTYLGHAELRDTQVYLTMTPELLSCASLKFEKYVKQGAGL